MGERTQTQWFDRPYPEVEPWRVNYSPNSMRRCVRDTVGEAVRVDWRDEDKRPVIRLTIEKGLNFYTVELDLKARDRLVEMLTKPEATR